MRAHAPHLLLVAGLASLVGLAVAPACAAPIIETRENHYDIAGASIDELRAQMKERGPYSDTAEAHVPARMEADVGFRFTARRHGTGCRLGDIEVTADIAYHYPRWTGISRAPMYLAEKWSLYLARLRIHEEGHGQMVVDAAHEVTATLKAMGRWKRCSQLRAVARARAEAILRQMKKAQADYDAETGGGETQGAVFRKNPPAIN